MANLGFKLRFFQRLDGMERYAISLLVLLACLLVPKTAYAQSFTDRLRKSVTGQGTVILIQDEDITRLVNGKSAQTNSVRVKLKPMDDTDVLKRGAEGRNNRSDDDDISLGEETTAPVMKQKTYRRSYSMRGYRVQIYSGNDSRAARQKAYQMGSLLKNYFPDWPVYTHFYSPHWTCRVGDFRSYQEASTALHQINKTGAFKAAAIINCTIQVGFR